MHVTAVSGSFWGRDRIVPGGAGASGAIAARAWPAPGYACPMAASLDDASVEPIVRKTAAWAWRLLVVLAAGVALLWVVAKLEIIVVPVLLALMISALLLPAVDWLDR